MEDPLGRQFLVILLLIVINAFFAAAEIAVISLNGAKVRRDAEEGDADAKKMLKLVDHPTQFFSTIQIVITLAGFLASAFAADTFSDRLVHWLINDCGWTIGTSALNTICVIAITLVLSYFTLVFGELVPKRIAMAKSEKVTKFSCGIVLGASAVFRPFVWLLSVSTNGVLRLFGIDGNAGKEGFSEEEIRLMVDLGEERGSIQKEERRMIENIFKFNNITAEDVMIHRKEMIILWLDDTPEEIFKRIEESGLSRFPVFGEDIDDIKGILHVRDYLLNAQKGEDKPLSQPLRPAYLVPETVPADVLFREMQRKKEHMAIVVDEYGGTSGLVTLEDLLEEIVGNIYDEFDPMVEQEITQLEENLWRVSGGCEIETFCEALDITLPEEIEEDFDTVGGLIFSQMSEIPADGTQPKLDAFGLHIQVEEITNRHVEWALVHKLPAENPETEEE